MKKLLTISIACYIAIFSTISLWKYGQLRYNARDLAIYNQVVWQIATNSKLKTQNSKRWSKSADSQNPKISYSLADRFYSSIQGHNYLGDHFEPILLLLVPFYAFIPDPRTLLILQTLALALAAWPLYLIAMKLMETTPSPPYEGGERRGGLRWVPTFIVILWLLHPAVQNANLYEFHSVAFAPLALFSLFFSYLKIREAGAYRCLHEDCLSERGERVPQKKIAYAPRGYYLVFIILLLLALFVREDMALITFMLGLVFGAQEWKKRRLTSLPIIMMLVSAAWFLMAQRIIAHFSPSHGYQYRIYYQWLSQYNTVFEAVRGILLHLFTLQNIEMFIGLFLPLLFLPLIKPKLLLLTLPSLAAIVLAQSGGGALVWQMHYGLLLLPGIFLAGIYAITQFPHINKKLFDPLTLLVATITAALASSLAFGPILSAVQAIAAKPQSATAAFHTIPADASVLVTDTFLAPLSSRQHITLMPLSLMGVQQYGVASYPSSIPPDYIIFNEDDLWADLIQARTLAWSAPFAGEMRARFRQLLNTGGYAVIAQTEGAALLKQTSTVTIKFDDTEVPDYASSLRVIDKCFVRKSNCNGTSSETTIPPFDFETQGVDARKGGFVLDRLGSVMFVEDTIH